LRGGISPAPLSGFAMTVADLSWKIAGVADFNGDGRADILYRKETTGETFLYLMNGTTGTGDGFAIAVDDLNWKIASTADFNADGRDDLAKKIQTPP